MFQFLRRRMPPAEELLAAVALAATGLPAVATASVGHVAELPLQLSATSQASTAGRQTAPAAAKASAGHAAEDPEQVSATSQTLAALGAMNPQIAYGEDVMSRINHAIHHQGGEQLRAAIVDALNALVRIFRY